MLEVADLRVAYAGEFTALHGVSLSVRSGEAVALVGANGAGKTTLLKTSAGPLHAGGGEIRFDGLMAASDINNAQAADSQSNAGVQEIAFVVRPPMVKGLTHDRNDPFEPLPG